MKRVIDTEFWNDDRIVDMFSPEDKLFFLYLMTNPHTTQLGVYHINMKVMAFEIGYSKDAVSVLIDRFQNKYNLIKYSPETSEIAIKNYLKHSIVKGGKPVEDLLTAEVEKVKDKSLLKYIYDNLKNVDNLNASVEAILPVLEEHIYIFSNITKNNTNNNITNITNNINDNDNDNVVSYHDSHNDSFYDSSKSTKTTKKSFTPPTIEEIQQYIDERNSNVDAQKFYDYFTEGNWTDSKGNKVKNWKQKLITWEKFSEGEPRKKGGLFG